MAEQREQRRPDPRREVPQQVGGPEELREPALADAVGARRAKILLVLLVHDQERADIAEPVLLEPLEEELRQTLVTGLRTRRDEHVQPEYIVAQVSQTQEVLEGAGPVPATLRVPGQRAGQYEPET